jgi:two-component system CheB/CheR fusion protein
VPVLERELTAARDGLQTALDESADAEHEFRLATEELQSTNEELQSTNEELETSKEELQSSNEELLTVNEELQNRMKELGEINDDLHNVLLGVDQAVVIADLELRIRRYTLAAERLFNLVPGHVGHSIELLERFMGTRALRDTVTTVIRTLAPADEEVHASNHRWYRLRVVPYKTLEHAVTGAIISLADIDVRKKASELVNEVSDYALKYLATVQHPLVMIDRRLRISWVNPPFFTRFKLVREEVLGSLLADLGTRGWLDPGLHDRLLATLDRGVPLRDVAVSGLLRDEPFRVMRVGATRVPISTDAPMALVSFEEAATVAH